jgi:phosphatidylglycerol lysyltransferase
MRQRLTSAVPALLVLVIFVAALEVLRRELHAVSWHTLVGHIVGTPPDRLVAAVVLTALNYGVLTLYDFIAFATLGKSLPRWRVATVSFLAYAIANNVGFALLSGASVRYRFYTRWGVTAEELSRIVFSYSVTFWLGLFALGGLSLLLTPLSRSHELPGAALAAPVGLLLIALSVGYVVLTVVRPAPVRILRTELPLPPPRIAIAQFLVSAIDWALAAGVLYVLLPSGDASFLAVLAAFLAAQLLALASHVPGGVGVFEGLMIVLLKPAIAPGPLLSALVVYRAIYYLLPLSVALVALVADEVPRRRSQAVKVAAFLGLVSEWATPRLLAAFTFVGGLVLLFSGATPAAEGRLRWLQRFLPLGVIETSHFAGSLAGAILLLLSQGLARRLDAAYYLSGIVIVVGILASLLKGADYEEATLLTMLLLVLWRSRTAFDRRAALLETRFSSAWTAAVLAALAASGWLGLFAFKHVEYTHDLWWQFELDAEASRFLRGSVGAAAVTLLFAFSRLIRHAPHEIEEPTQADLEAARAVIDKQPFTSPNLVFLRDKALLFDADRAAFVMYGVQGRSWVALGDPVGPPDRVPALVRMFLERCDDFGGTPVFYEIRKDYLHHYADFGLTFVKLGEEARVDLRQFTLEGSAGAKFRQTIRRLEKDGGHFRLLPLLEVPAVLDQLQTVSDSWLAERAGSEKGFSLGFFDREYLSRQPVAVIERGGRIQAFANLWPSAEKEELSIDLMRYHHDAPKGVMEALFVHLLKWGKDEGYRWFGLGMAPMSGFEESPVAPLWTHVGMFLYEHGEPLYNFRGLRAYKEKFNPVWESHYLAYPGGLKLPRILADVSALVAGGYRRIFI